MRLELSREAVQRLRGGTPLWPPGGRRDEPHPVAFHATSVWCGSGLSGMGPKPVDVLSAAHPCRGASGHARQAGPQDLVHRRGLDRPYPPRAGHLPLLRLKVEVCTSEACRVGWKGLLKFGQCDNGNLASSALPKGGERKERGDETDETESRSDLQGPGGLGSWQGRQDGG